jgi:hypothetical protein
MSRKLVVENPGKSRNKKEIQGIYSDYQMKTLKKLQNSLLAKIPYTGSK